MNEVVSKRKRRKFQWEMIVWGLIYAAIYWAIGQKIQKDFGYMISAYVIVEESAEGYQEMLVWIFMAAIILSLIWWMIAVCDMRAESWFENNAFLFAVLFWAMLLICIFLRQREYRGILDNNGDMHVLRYGYCVFGGFLINLYGFPPKAMRTVIFFGGKVGRIIPAAVGAAIVILAWIK